MDSRLAEVIRHNHCSVNVSILDVGAGPLTILGNVLEGYNIKLVATDPLAPLYDQMLLDASLTPPIRTVFAPVEGLSAFFDHSSFDIVYCRNALDHSADPVGGITEMLRVVKVNGTVVLRHSTNEAEREQYKGFHQHNFDCREGKFVIWNKEGVTVIDEALPVRSNLQTRCENEHIETLITKLEEFPDSNDIQRVKVALSGLWTNIILFLCE